MVTALKTKYTRPIVADMVELFGRIFSEISELSVLKSFIPPILSAGKMAIAITIMPMPPTQFMMQRQNSTDFGNFSKPENTVEPVVVSADTVSNQASV